MVPSQVALNSKVEGFVSASFRPSSIIFLSLGWLWTYLYVNLHPVICGSDRICPKACQLPIAFRLYTRGACVRFTWSFVGSCRMQLIWSSGTQPIMSVRFGLYSLRALTAKPVSDDAGAMPFSNILCLRRWRKVCGRTYLSKLQSITSVSSSVFSYLHSVAWGRL